MSKKFGPADVRVFQCSIVIQKRKSIVAILKDNLTPSNKPSAISRLFSSLKVISKPLATSNSACHSHADSQPKQEQTLQTKEREDQQQVATQDEQQATMEIWESDVFSLNPAVAV